MGGFIHDNYHIPQNKNDEVLVELVTLVVLELDVDEVDVVELDDLDCAENYI